MVSPNPSKKAKKNYIILVPFLGVNPLHFVEEIPRGIHLRQPSLGWVMTVLTAELTHFKLVIRLSKVQQLAFPFCTAFWVSCWSCGPLWNLVEYTSVTVKPCWTFRNLLFCSNVTATQHHAMTKEPGRHTTSRCGPLSFDGYLVRWNMSCT